jgi:hypothetical protein
MTIAAVVTLLQTALLLLNLSQSTPNLPQATRDYAAQVANQAIQQATLALSTSGSLSTAPTVVSSTKSTLIPDTLKIVSPSSDTSIAVGQKVTILYSVGSNIISNDPAIVERKIVNAGTDTSASTYIPVSVSGGVYSFNWTPNEAGRYQALLNISYNNGTYPARSGVITVGNVSTMPASTNNAPTINFSYISSGNIIGSFANLPANSQIRLVNASTGVRYDAQSTMVWSGGSGPLSITIPNDLASGTYYLRATNYYDPNTTIAQSGSFQVGTVNTSATTIQVTYPQAGNILLNGSEKSNNAIANIQWTEQNGDYPVNIWLLNQSGQIIKAIAYSAPDTGSYVWAYDPSLPSGTYGIEIDVLYQSGASGQDRAYSGYFTVTKPISPSTIDQTSVNAYSNSFTLSGTASNSSAVFVALVRSDYSGPMDWHTIYTNHAYVASSGDTVSYVSGGRWSASLAGVSGGTYKTLLFNNSSGSQELLASGALSVSTPSSLSFTAGSGVPITLGVGQSATDGGMTITLNSVYYTNGTSGTPMANFTITVNGYSPGSYVKTIGETNTFGDPASPTGAATIMIQAVSTNLNSATFTITAPIKG